MTPSEVKLNLSRDLTPLIATLVLRVLVAVSHRINVLKRSIYAANYSIGTHQLKKIIKGKEIIKGVNLTLYPSQIFGFLGPNGAGKTTTILMIVGLIKPTEGSVTICGYSVAHDFVKAMSNIGCIIESPDMYKYLTGMENSLQFAAMNRQRRCI